MADIKMAKEVKHLATLLSGNQPIHSGQLPEYLQGLQILDAPPLAAAESARESLLQTVHEPEHFSTQLTNLEHVKAPGLASVLAFMGRLSEDENVAKFLKENAYATSSSHLSATSETSLISTGSESKLSSEDVNRILRNKLKKGTQSLSQTGRLGKPFHLESVTGRDRKKTDYIPVMPEWVSRRPFLTLGFLEEGSLTEHGPLDLIPPSSQERALIDDLLHCMSGVDGGHISVRADLKSVEVTDRVDPSLRDMVACVAPVALHYATVMRFVEDQFVFKSGLVLNALGAAMRTLLKDYLVFVTQLETQHRRGELTLQKMVFYSKPALHTMQVLADLILAAHSVRHSGAVLSILHERTCAMVGDPKAQAIMVFLTQAAAQPFLEMLEKWIYKGIIVDPYQEFLLEDTDVLSNIPTQTADDYWEKRYVVRPERTPVFLERVAIKILKTGKYLNVMRQCGKSVAATNTERIVYNINEQTYMKSIEKAYSTASKTLLDLLMTEQDLMSRLRSVKHYFLLDQGDFVVQFMDLCESELMKNIDDIVPSRLESLLELALRTSGARVDPYKDLVRVELLPYDLGTQMFRILSISTQNEGFTSYSGMLTGIRAFSFGYEVQWPVSLILNYKVLACYQMMFRHLFYCKHVERVLCLIWTRNKGHKLACLTSESHEAGFALLQQMINFVQNLEYYMTFEVLEPYWHLFLVRIEKVQNVDDVIACHTDFVDSCLKDCMLTNPQLLKTVTKLLDMCVDLCMYVAQAVSTKDEDMGLQLARYKREFNEGVTDLLQKIAHLGKEKYSDKLINILHRLDFNGFYTRKARYESELGELLSMDS